jgi:hypothetical protein
MLTRLEPQEEYLSASLLQLFTRKQDNRKDLKEYKIKMAIFFTYPHSNMHSTFPQ